MSNYKSGKLSNIMLAVVLILVAMLVVGAVLGNVKGKDSNPDTPIDNVQQEPTNPLDEIKPVENLTSDMWVTGWLIDPAKEPDMDKVNAFMNTCAVDDDGTIIMKPVDYDTLNFPSYLVGNGYNNSMLSLVLSPVYFGFRVSGSDLGVINGLYVFKGSEGHVMFGGYGWLKGSLYDTQLVTEKYLFELPCAIKYDCTNYDLVKEFMTPVVEEEHECVQPVPLDENRLIKGFRIKALGKGLDISDSDLKCGDEFLKGTIAYNPAELELGFSGFRLVQEDNSIYLHGIFGGERIVYLSVYYSSYNAPERGFLIKNMSLSSSSVLFPNGVLYKFDNTEYMNKKLWRFIEPIYAEEITDSEEKNVVAYNVDWSKVGYVDLESNFSKNYFSVSKYSYSHNFTEISTNFTLNYIDISTTSPIVGSGRSFYYYENLDAVRELMTQLNYDGTLGDFINVYFKVDYDDTQYGVLTYGTSDTSVMIMIDWLNANGFADAVTPIYSQYK